MFRPRVFPQRLIGLYSFWFSFGLVLSCVMKPLESIDGISSNFQGYSFWTRYRFEKNFGFLRNWHHLQAHSTPQKSNFNKKQFVCILCPELKVRIWVRIYITKTCLFKYIENFTIRKGKFSDKKFWFFSFFCSKHRSWVLVRIASTRQF